MRPTLPWPSVGRARPSPWFPGDKVTLLWTNGVGVVGLMASYFGTSGTVTQSTQVRWIAVAVGAAGVGNATWLAAGARSIRTRRHDSHGRLLGVVELEAARPSVETVGVS